MSPNAPREPATDTPSPRNGRRRDRTDPQCPVPRGGLHNSVRAAKAGCTCPDGAAALHRERQRDRAHKATQAFRDDKNRKRREARAARHTPVRRYGTAPQPSYTADGLDHDLLSNPRAACRREDPDLFFPEGDGPLTRTQTALAKQVCGRCPLQGDCLTVALRRAEPYGIYGGLTADERRALRARGWAA